MVNYRFMANAVWTTEGTVKKMWAPAGQAAAIAGA
jgi:hypothetical protein